MKRTDFAAGLIIVAVLGLVCGIFFSPKPSAANHSPLSEETVALRERIAELERERDNLLDKVRAQPPPVVVRTPVLWPGLEEQLRLKIGEFEREDQVKDETIVELKELLADIKRRLELFEAEASRSLVEEFLKTANALGIEPEEQEYLTGLIPVLGEIPSPWEIKELSKAAKRFYPMYHAWQREWSTRQSELKGDFSHPENQALLAEQDELLNSWGQDLVRILGSDRAEKIL